MIALQARYAILLISLLVTACDQEPRTAPVENAVPSREKTQAAEVAPPTTYDDVLRDIGNRIPAFGGMFVDTDGRLVVLSRTGKLSPGDLQVLRSLMTAHQLSDEVQQAVGTARIAPAEYAFTDILRWRDSILATTIPDLVLVDADEQSNRVVVRVQGQNGLELVRVVAIRAAVPSGALDIAISEPAHPASSPVPPPPFVSLASHFNVGGRLSYPGVRVAAVDAANNIINLCTATRFLRDVVDDHPVLTQEYVLTAAHCAGHLFAFHGTRLVQPIWSPVPSDYTQLGTEYINPGADHTPGHPCNQGYSCRWSDAVLYLSGHADYGEHYHIITAGIPAVPSNPPQSDGGRRMTDCCAALPTVGQHVWKTGSQTGTSQDVVLKTCVFMSVYAGEGVMCQNLAGSTFTPSSGYYTDSGAPVWIESASAVLFHGLLVLYWHDGATNYYGYSTSNSIRYELGLTDAAISLGVY